MDHEVVPALLYGSSAEFLDVEHPDFGRRGAGCHHRDHGVDEILEFLLADRVDDVDEPDTAVLDQAVLERGDESPRTNVVVVIDSIDLIEDGHRIQLRLTR